MSSTFVAMRVKQWLSDWEKVDFLTPHRRKPQPFFYLFKLPYKTLIEVSDVYRRKETGKRSEDLHIQRKHTPERSLEIMDFIKGGFPWSALPAGQKENRDNNGLFMPGWLPTAIIANILPRNYAIGEMELPQGNEISIEEFDSDFSKIKLPELPLPNTGELSLKPMEIIDGQHRLLALRDIEGLDGDFEVPIVAFEDLDVTWQAYLFYTINIKPKKINKSLAFDLFPLLRTQDWLANSSEANVYRETRSQELTEALWLYNKSPWKNRISMLGENSRNQVSQAAFIRHISTIFFKSKKSGGSLGGLFSSSVNNDESGLLDWNRTQQAAFLISCWSDFFDFVLQEKSTWANDLRNPPEGNLFSDSECPDLVFFGKHSLINTDQGVSAFLKVVNNFVFVLGREFHLTKWMSTAEVSMQEDTIDYAALGHEIEHLRDSDFYADITNLLRILSEFDWRSSSTPDLDKEERKFKSGYRGTGGYKRLYEDVIDHLKEKSTGRILDIVNQIG